MKKHLFVVAHPDDEVLGAGATIYDAVQRGDEAAAVVLNTCDNTRYEYDRTQIIDDLNHSHEVIGISKSYLGRYDDSNFHNENHRDMVRFIEGAIRDFQPDFIYTQDPGDVNTDHYWTAASCMEAFRLFQRGREDVHPVEALFTMEVQSSTDWGISPTERRFQPNTFVQVSLEAVKAKIDALSVYENVIRPIPHPRSYSALWSLPTLRGAQAGFPLAEAFNCVFRRVVL